MKKLLLFLIFIPFFSFAQLDIQNNSFDDVWISIGYFENNKWYSKGWWEVERHKKVRVYNKRLSNRYYYIYAYQTKNSSVWSGSAQFCAPSRKFTLRDIDCYNDTKGFKKVDVGNSNYFVISLTEDSLEPGGIIPDLQWIDRN